MKETCVISGNVALGGVGGDIHSSYECALHLDGGTVSENIVYGHGGGIAMIMTRSGEYAHQLQPPCK